MSDNGYAAPGGGQRSSLHAGAGVQLPDTSADTSKRPPAKVYGQPEVPVVAVDNKTVEERKSSVCRGHTVKLPEAEASSAKEDIDLCTICFEGQRETALAPCGHRALCRCVNRLTNYACHKTHHAICKLFSATHVTSDFA